MSNRKSIFESVTFLNEGIAGGVILSGLLLAAGIMATVELVKESINDSKDKKMIKNALKYARENNEKIAELDKRIKHIRSFSKEEFLKQDFVTDNDRYKLKSISISIYCALDEKGKIIAYTLYHKPDTFLFNSLEKLDNDCVEYLKALFEYRMGIKGKSLKEFLKISEFKNPYRYLGKDSPKIQYASDDDLTNEEKDRINKDRKELFNIFLKFVKSEFPGYRVYTDEFESISIYDKNEPILPDGTIRNNTAYDNYYMSGAPQAFLDKADKMLERFIKKYKLDGNKEMAIGTKDNFPYLKIVRNDNPDDFLTADFDIETSFDI